MTAHATLTLTSERRLVPGTGAVHVVVRPLMSTRRDGQEMSETMCPTCFRPRAICRSTAADEIVRDASVLGVPAGGGGTLALGTLVGVVVVDPYDVEVDVDVEVHVLVLVLVLGSPLVEELVGSLVGSLVGPPVDSPEVGGGAPVLVSSPPCMAT